MNHMEILKRAWHMVTRYRALWVFGIILALTTASFQAPSSSRSSGGNGSTETQTDANKDYTIDPDSDVGQQMEEGMKGAVKGLETMFEDGTLPGTLRMAAIVLGCLFLSLIIVLIVLRWVAEVSLIRMVDQYEETGERATWRAGFKMGWSRYAWRLFLLSVLVTFPALLVFILLVGVTVVPLTIASIAAWEGGQIPAGVATMVGAIGLSFLYIFLAIIYAVVARLVVKIARRVCVLEDKGVVESLREGYTMARQNLKDVGIMWLIMAGVSIGYPIVIIPVIFLLLAAGALVGGIFGLTVWGVTGLFAGDLVAWITAGTVGGLLFILVVVLPLLFLGGLREVFTSSSWTLTFRELRALATLEPAFEPLNLPDGDVPAAA